MLQIYDKMWRKNTALLFNVDKKNIAFKTWKAPAFGIVRILQIETFISQHS